MASRLLLVEDNAEGVYALSEALQRRLSGMAVESVTSAEDALRRLLEREYDVILCDVLLTRLNGLAVLEAAQKRYPHTSVILMTAGEFDAEPGAMMAGAFAFVPKPLDLDALLRLITSGLERTTVLRETWRRQQEGDGS